MFRHSLLCTLLILAFVKNSWAHASGANPLACSSLVPSHGPNTPQTSAVPAQIAFDSGANVQSGQLLTMSLRASPGTSFRGFLVQARRADISGVPQSGEHI